MTRKFKYLIPAIAIVLMGAAFQYGGLKLDITSQVSSVSPIVLSSASTQIQRVTGSANQVVKLPDATTLRAGYFYYLSNEGSGTLTISNSASTQVVQLAAGNTTTQGAFLFLTSNSTAAGPWTYGTLGGSGGGSSFTPSEIYLQGVGGTPYGSVGTKRPRFTSTPVKSIGTDATYTDSSNDGTIITINTTGGYCINYTSAFSGSAADMGLTLNNTQGSTNIGSVTAADVMVLTTTAASAIGGTAQVCSNLTAGDTISPQTDGATISSASRSVSFRIVRVY